MRFYPRFYTAEELCQYLGLTPLRQLAEAPTPELTPPLRRAANDAAALAWATLYPLLVFPVLFEEKIAAALRQAERQARIFKRSRELLAV
jgi:hypothetical protein